MNKVSSFSRILSAAFLLATVATPIAPAQNSPYSIGVYNTTKHAVWVTTYWSATGRSGGILAAKCYLPGVRGQGQSSQNPSGGGWVLFEIKKEADTCANHSNLTTIEQNVRRGADIKQNGDKIYISGN